MLTLYLSQRLGLSLHTRHRSKNSHHQVTPTSAMIYLVVVLVELPTTRFKTFDYMGVKSTTTSLKIIIIYHPRASALHPFLAEISTYLSDITVAREDIIIVGDFNLHLKLPNATGVKEFIRLLAENNLVQHVTKHTHRAGHTLVITRADSSLVSATDVFNSSISDHYNVIFNLATAKPSHVKQRGQVQDFRRMDQECFEADLSMALREINLKLDTNSLLLAYTKAVSNTINKYILREN